MVLPLKSAPRGRKVGAVLVPPKNAPEAPTCAAWNGSVPIPAPGTLNGRYCETANRMPRFRRFNVAKAGVATSTLPAAQAAQKKLAAGGQCGQADAYQPEPQ